MAFSGITLHYAITDINAYLPARIQKIQVLSAHQWVLHLYHKSGFKLYLNLSSEDAKIHRTELDFPMKSEPTVFVNHLKKWLINGRLMPFQQVSKDRIITADIETKNALFDTVTVRLIIEFFGKDTNLILVDASKKIIDCLKTSGSLFSRPRVIQIGATYQSPLSTKNDPLEAAAVERYFQDPQGLTTFFDGLSASLAESLKKMQTPEAFLKALTHPYFYRSSNTPVFEKLDETALDWVTWADHHLHQKLTQKPYDQRRIAIAKKLQQRLARAQRKKAVLAAELANVPLAKTLISEGQGLMASPYKDQKLKRLEIIDYQNNTPLTVTLDGTKTVLENAQLRFKKAKKLKASIPHLNKQRKLNQEDIDYYALLLYQLEDATQDSLDEMYQELMEKRIIPRQNIKKPKKKSFKTVKTVHQNVIYIGLNNQQNATLTHEKAHPQDTWAHVRGYPGSHVILKTPTPTPEEIVQACEIAAYYSKARALIEVDVDVTKIKYVKKIPGQHGCFVRYDHAKTISVKPQSHEKKA